MSEFVWAEHRAVIFPTTFAVAVYPNANGGITIRQMGSDPGEDDDIVHIPDQLVPAFIRALRQAVKEGAE